MGTPQIDNGYRVLLLWAAQPGGRPWSTKFDYVDEPEAGPLEPVDVAEAFATQFASAWGGGGTSVAQYFHETAQLDTVRVYRLTDPLTGAEVAGPTIVDGTGTTVLPAEVAAVSSLRTPFLGRRFRGRQYWGGLAPAAVDSATGQLAAGFRSALAELVEDMGTMVVESVDLRHAVISSGSSTADRPPAIGTVVTQVIVDQFPDTQRRRGAR